MHLGGAALAKPEIYEFLEAQGYAYTIRLPTNPILQETISHLLSHLAGRPPNRVRRTYASVSYQANGWSRPWHVVANVKWHPVELGPPVGFVVTNLSRSPERVTNFHQGRGTAKQRIKDGKNAINWTRLSNRDTLGHRLLCPNILISKTAGAFRISTKSDRRHVSSMSALGHKRTFGTRMSFASTTALLAFTRRRSRQFAPAPQHHENA